MIEARVFEDEDQVSVMTVAGPVKDVRMNFFKHKTGKQRDRLYLRLPTYREVQELVKTMRLVDGGQVK